MSYLLSSIPLLLLFTLIFCARLIIFLTFVSIYSLFYICFLFHLYDSEIAWVDYATFTPSKVEGAWHTTWRIRLRYGI